MLKSGQELWESWRERLRKVDDDLEEWEEEKPAFLEELESGFLGERMDVPHSIEQLVSDKLQRLMDKWKEEGRFVGEMLLGDRGWEEEYNYNQEKFMEESGLYVADSIAGGLMEQDLMEEEMDENDIVYLVDAMWDGIEDILRKYKKKERPL